MRTIRSGNKTHRTRAAFQRQLLLALSSSSEDDLDSTASDMDQEEGEDGVDEVILRQAFEGLLQHGHYVDPAGAEGALPHEEVVNVEGWEEEDVEASSQEEDDDEDILMPQAFPIEMQLRDVPEGDRFMEFLRAIAYIKATCHISDEAMNKTLKVIKCHIFSFHLLSFTTCFHHLSNAFQSISLLHNCRP